MLQNVQHTLYWQCSGTVTKVQHSTSKPRQFVYFCPQIELSLVSYVDSVYAWRRVSASAVVGEARAWLPSYGDAELATGDNGQTLAMGQQIGGLYISFHSFTELAYSEEFRYWFFFWCKPCILLLNVKKWNIFFLISCSMPKEINRWY